MTFLQKMRSGVINWRNKSQNWKYSI
jgi:hypothetical protein